MWGDRWTYLGDVDECGVKGGHIGDVYYPVVRSLSGVDQATTTTSLNLCRTPLADTFMSRLC